MSTSTSRAGYLRGGLVSVCSTVVTAFAHSIAGGEAPSGAAAMLLIVACATAGIAMGAVTVDGRYARMSLVVGGLCFGQALGHVVLTVGGSRHGDCGWMLTAPMLSVHATAAVALGLAISIVEYLYAVCASSSSHCRLFATTQVRPIVRLTRFHPSNVFVVRPILLRAGLGMRRHRNCVLWRVTPPA